MLNCHISWHPDFPAGAGRENIATLAWQTKKRWSSSTAAHSTSFPETNLDQSCEVQILHKQKLYKPYPQG